jgi:hypothetical protein
MVGFIVQNRDRVMEGRTDDENRQKPSPLETKGAPFRRGRRSPALSAWIAIRLRDPACERWCSFAQFFADVGERPSWRHLMIRDDPTGVFEPSNARWRVAARYRWRRPTARSR